MAIYQQIVCRQPSKGINTTKNVFPIAILAPNVAKSLKHQIRASTPEKSIHIPTDPVKQAAGNVISGDVTGTMPSAANQTDKKDHVTTTTQ